MSSPGWLCTALRGIGATALVVGLFALGSSAAYASAPAATWKGESETSAKWSADANWETGLAPSIVEGIGTLTFPHLSQPTCATESPTEACYIGENNYLGLPVESLHIDDGDEYLLVGDPIMLGSGGLTAAPAAGTSGPAGDVIEMPIDLDATQKWSFSSHGGTVEENGAIFAGNITGEGDGLTMELGNGPLVLLGDNNTEVGPVSIEGAKSSEPAVSNGVAAVVESKLNSVNGEPVNVSHVFFAGADAELGALATTDADLDVANIEAKSAKLDSGSLAEFEVIRTGSTPRTDYTQLTSPGTVELGDANLAVLVVPPREGACPTLSRGQTLTFVSTTGTLSGQFANAPEGGPEISIDYLGKCPSEGQKIQIAYHKSEGSTHTVTGTVEEAAAKQEEAARKQREAEEAKRHQQEEEANRRRSEEAAAHGTGPSGGGTGTTGGATPSGGVLGITEASISIAQISAALSDGLTPTGKGAKIAALFKAGGFTITFKALEAGSVVIDWFEVPAGGKLAKKHKAKPVPVASGQAVFESAGAAKIKIKLTAAGKHLLRRAKHVKLTARGTFTPAGGQGVSVTRAFVLTR